MVRAEIARSIALLLALVIGFGAGIARANDEVGITNAAVVNRTSGAPAIDRNFPGVPLLPCPRSVPCLPTSSDSGYAPAPVASVRLLPCPFSIPCFTTGRSIDVPVRRKAASPRAWRPGPATHWVREHAATGPAIKYRRSDRMAATGSHVWPRDSIAPRPSGTRPGEMALRDDAVYRVRAERLLNEVELKLGRLDRSRLNPDQSQVYSKTNDLTAEGIKALRRGDNAAALGFAEKAQQLSDNLDTSAATRLSKRAVAAFSW